MIYTIQEISAIINSVEARKEWCEDEGEYPDEQPHLESALRKLKSQLIEIETEEKRIGYP